MSPLIQCPNCRSWLLGEVFNRPELIPCRSCGVPLQVEVFPALFRPAATGQQAQPVLTEGESSCFFHPQKTAVRPCDGCGRFLCALCDCELNQQHFCPACLESGKTKGRIKSLANQRTRNDLMALWLAIVPLLIFYLTIITAPMTLFIAIRYWRAPQSLVHKTHFWFTLAIIIALLEIAGWTALFITMSTRHT